MKGITFLLVSLIVLSIFAFLSPQVESGNWCTTCSPNPTLCAPPHGGTWHSCYDICMSSYCTHHTYCLNTWCLLPNCDCLEACKCWALQQQQQQQQHENNNMKTTTTTTWKQQQQQQQQQQQHEQQQQQHEQQQQHHEQQQQHHHHCIISEIILISKHFNKENEKTLPVVDWLQVEILWLFIFSSLHSEKKTNIYRSCVCRWTFSNSYSLISYYHSSSSFLFLLLHSLKNSSCYSCPFSNSNHSLWTVTARLFPLSPLLSSLISLPLFPLSFESKRLELNQ